MTVVFDKKINLGLSNKTPYDVVFKENGLKWGRIIQRVDSIPSQGEANLIIANKNNTNIIEGTVVFSIDCPVKHAELVLQVSVSQGKPFVLHAQFTVEGRQVEFVQISDRERLSITNRDVENPDNWEPEYFEQLNLIYLHHA